MHMIEGNMVKRLEWYGEMLFCVMGPITTDIALGCHSITSGIGAAMIGCYCGAMLRCVTSKEHLGPPNKKEEKGGAIDYKSAAHATDLAEGHLGAQYCNNVLAKARFEFRWEDQFNLTLAPVTARAFHDERLPQECAKIAHCCSTKLTEHVRKYAVEQGVSEEGVLKCDRKEKWKELVGKGAEVYVKE